MRLAEHARDWWYGLRGYKRAEFVAVVTRRNGRQEIHRQVSYLKPSTGSVAHGRRL